MDRPPMIEFELKLEIPPPQLPALLAAVREAGPASKRLQARYFDTDDDALARAGIVLRLRKEGRTWVQTAKCAGDGPLERLEHNVAVGALPPGAQPEVSVSRHEHAPLGERIRRALDVATLDRRARAAGTVRDRRAAAGLQGFLRGLGRRGCARSRQGHGWAAGVSAVRDRVRTDPGRPRARRAGWHGSGAPTTGCGSARPASRRRGGSWLRARRSARLWRRSHRGGTGRPAARKLRSPSSERACTRCLATPARSAPAAWTPSTSTSCGWASAGCAPRCGNSGPSRRRSTRNGSRPWSRSSARWENSGTMTIWSARRSRSSWRRAPRRLTSALAAAPGPRHPRCAARRSRMRCWGCWNSRTQRRANQDAQGSRRRKPGDFSPSGWTS